MNCAEAKSSAYNSNSYIHIRSCKGLAWVPSIPGCGNPAIYATERLAQELVGVPLTVGIERVFWPARNVCSHTCGASPERGIFGRLS